MFLSLDGETPRNNGGSKKNKPEFERQSTNRSIYQHKHNGKNTLGLSSTFKIPNNLSQNYHH